MRLSLTAPLLIATLLSSVAHSKVVYRSGDWELDDSSGRNVPQGVCTMQTTVDDRINWRLEISMPKKIDAPVEVFLRQDGRSAGVWNANLRDGTAISFAASAVDRNKTLFWAVPRNTTALIAQLEDRRDLTMKPADDTRDPRLTFSADGFSRVLKEMKKRCTNDKEAAIVNAAFEAAFLPAANRTVSPVGISQEAVKELRQLLAQGYEIFKRKSGNDAEMIQLRQRFSVQLNEAASLEATIAQLSGTDIPMIQQAQMRNDSLESQNRSELARLTALIPHLQNSVNASAQVLSRAQAILAPFEAEHSQRYSAARSARSQVRNGQNRIAQIDSERNSLVQQSRQLQMEYDRASQVAQNAEAQLYEARKEAGLATRHYQNFNPSGELQRRLMADATYRRAQSELPRAETEARRLDREVERNRGKRDAAQTALNTCKAVAEADCSAQTAALATANNELAKVKDEERAANSRASTLRSQMNSAENRAAREVEMIRNDLINRMNNANQRVSQLENIASSNQRRASEISRYEIPRINDQVSALDRERPMVVADVNRNTPVAQRLESELAQYEQRVGWDAKVGAVNDAQNVLDARTQELNRAQAGKSGAEQTIANCISERSRLAAALNNKQSLLAQAQSRQIQVRESLVPFEAKRMELEGIGSGIALEFDGAKQRFENLLPL